jgi:hypothetical protein
MNEDLIFWLKIGKFMQPIHLKGRPIAQLGLPSSFAGPEM